MAAVGDGVRGCPVGVGASVSTTAAPPFEAPACGPHAASPSRHAAAMVEIVFAIRLARDTD